jgi:predicted enzyme related to lactoylglutathione lyase
MLQDSPAFSGYSVNDIVAVKKFYTDTLGIEIEDGPMGMQLKIAGTNGVFLYEKQDHMPASFTLLNFPVKDIDAAVDKLTNKGIKFEVYEGAHQDKKGIARGIAAQMGPDIAWFKDPAGNILSILHNDK